jgi:hypothetical protein
VNLDDTNSIQAANYFLTVESSLSSMQLLIQKDTAELPLETLDSSILPGYTLTNKVREKCLRYSK